MIQKYVDGINPMVPWSFLGAITIKETEEPEKGMVSKGMDKLK